MLAPPARSDDYRSESAAISPWVDIAAILPPDYSGIARLAQQSLCGNPADSARYDALTRLERYLEGSWSTVFDLATIANGQRST
jgi:hypothetical protein